jgi:hypothetical protein
MLGIFRCRFWRGGQKALDTGNPGHASLCLHLRILLCTVCYLVARDKRCITARGVLDSCMGALSSISCKRPAPAQLSVYMFLHIYVAGGVCDTSGGTQGDGVYLGAPHVSCATTCGIDVYELSRNSIGSGGLGLLSMPSWSAGRQNKRLHCFNKSGLSQASLQCRWQARRLVWTHTFAARCA